MISIVTEGLQVKEDEVDDSQFKNKPKKIKIKLHDGKERTIQHMMSTSFWGPDGKPVSATEFLETLFGTLPEFFRNEDELRVIWSQPETRKMLLSQLNEKGFGGEQLKEIAKLIDAESCDLYDVLSYVAFVTQPIPRASRAKTCHDYVSHHFEDKQQAFVDFVLEQYVKEGVTELDQEKLPILLALKYGSISDAALALGGAGNITKTFVSFQQYLYQSNLS